MKTTATISLWTALALLACGGVATWGEESPHQAAAQCKVVGDLDCNGVCVYCHTPPVEAIDIYAEGDNLLCSRCHASETIEATTGTFLLNHLGGNHPSQIYYDEGENRKDYNSTPAGPRLFCDPFGGRCKVLCSTCHDPHTLEGSLLRMSNQRSALCISCHRK